MAYIRFENLNKSFGDNHVLKDINLDIEKGELVTLLGPSGCGKSTLLRCLSGLEKVTSGKIYLDGVDITDVDPRDRGIGMVFQQYSLFPNMSVKDNVAFGLKMKKVPKDEIEKKVKQMLEIVGLSNVCIDDNGYVYGEIPASEGCENAPVIGFIAHILLRFLHQEERRFLWIHIL